VAFKNTILIVEDNSAIRELMMLFLAREGYKVAEAATGPGALDQAHLTYPDIIIMDLGLPGMDGDEVTARLKASPSTKDIPVIISTAFHKGAPIVHRAIAAGAAEILHKPIDVRTLIDTVRRYSILRGEGSFQVYESQASS
jgi:adenylate cyclase